MAVEAEFPMTMWTAFLGVAVIFALVLVILFCRMKSRGAVCCFAGQYALTWAAFSRLNSLILYGNVTLNMILCGISWGLSIVLMLLGCWLLVKKKEADHGTV